MLKNIDGIEVEVLKKPIKNINIRINREGKVSLSIPLKTSEETAYKFFKSKIKWVKSKMANKYPKTETRFLNGESIYIWGETVKLMIFEGGKNRVELNDGVLSVALKTVNEKNAKREVLKFCTELLREKSKILFEKWNVITGLKEGEVTIKKIISKWGYCKCATGDITLSLYLINLPIACLDYVVLHELCHIRYNNHGKGFKSLLDRCLPKWKLIRVFMKNNAQKYIFKI